MASSHTSKDCRVIKVPIKYNVPVIVEGTIWCDNKTCVTEVTNQIWFTVQYLAVVYLLVNQQFKGFCWNAVTLLFSDEGKRFSLVSILEKHLRGEMIISKLKFIKMFHI